MILHRFSPGLQACALAALIPAACSDGGPTSVLPPGPTSGYAAIAIGIHHGCGILAGEGAFCWGMNVAGELGHGAPTGSLSPVRVTGGSDFTAVTLAAGHSCALAADGTAWCWGS
ncbi:MAG TPA: RCC1 domain-containing protein, partial [Gemmatimonadota bacterium]|nr:RCC1 domain-containing protein [Gemmatimonadota bacterium]